MKIGLISDIHANLRGLEAALACLEDVDQILCAGDLTGYYTQPNEVIAKLRERGVKWIAGNHDVYLRGIPATANGALPTSVEFTRNAITAENATLLATAPCQMRVLVGGLHIAVFHGSPWNPQDEYIYPDFKEWERFVAVDADVVVMGHTHRPLLRYVAGKCIVNPGSVGQPRDGDPRAAYAVLDTEGVAVTFGRAAFDAAAADQEAAAAGLLLRKAGPAAGRRGVRAELVPARVSS